MWCLLKAHNDHRFNNINWSVSRVLHEANAIDKAYCMAIEENPVTHIPPQPRPTCLQSSVGPRIFCDASIGIQGVTTPNQTGIGIFILKTPARSVSYASFFQVAIPQILEPLEAVTLALLSRCQAGYGTQLAGSNSLY